MIEEYPSHLLPYRHYKLIDEAEIARQGGFVLIRYVEGDGYPWIDGTDVLNPNAIVIQSGHLRDLSNNLLGVTEGTGYFVTELDH